MKSDIITVLQLLYHFACRMKRIPQNFHINHVFDKKPQFLFARAKAQ